MEEGGGHSCLAADPAAASPPPPPSEERSDAAQGEAVAAAAEVDSLRAELAALNTKFATWRAKAKAGVDQQREQLRQLRGANELLQRTAADALLAAAAASADFAATCNAQLLEGLRRAAATASSSSSSSSSSFSEGAAAAAAAAAQLERYRRRSEQALRIAGSDLEQARAQAAAAQAAAEQRAVELAAARRELQEREQAMDELTQRLGDSIDAVAGLQQRLAHFAGSAAQQEELVTRAEDRARASFEKEWALRSAALEEAHRNEVSALVVAHEAELLEAACRVSQPARHTPSSDPAPAAAADSSSGGGGGGDDAAYVALLGEVDALHAELARATKEKAALLEQQQQQQQQGGGRKQQQQHSSSGGSSSGGAATEQAEQLLQELQRQRTQNWHLNQQLLELRARAQEAEAAATSDQQRAYLRSIFVQFACAKTSAVSAKLVPVLSSLLELRESDLRALYAANPSWAAS